MIANQLKFMYNIKYIERCFCIKSLAKDQLKGDFSGKFLNNKILI